MATQYQPLRICFSPLPAKSKHNHKIRPFLVRSSSNNSISGRKLQAAVIGAGPAGSSAAEALASGGVETFLFERNHPSTAKPCGGAIPLCMLDEFSIPLHLIDRHVTRMKIISPSNLAVDFGSKTLKPHEFIPMLRREVLDSFLRSRAESKGAQLISGLVTKLDVPTSGNSPYVIHYTTNSSLRSLAVDVIVGADGANSRVANTIKAGNYSCAIAFQERIQLPDDKMEYYQNLAEMYIGDDVSPDFYAWVFPKCDHVAVGTGTVCAKRHIKSYQRGIRERAKHKINGGKVIKVEAHPIPEHPRPVRVRGRVALVGDAAGYVTKCSGEGIYFAAKSGRMCGEAIIRASEGGEVMIKEEDLKREYLREWDNKYFDTFRVLNLLEKVFYGSNAAREALVEMCGDDYVQRMTFDSYLYKKLARGDGLKDVKMVFDTIGSLLRCKIMGDEGLRLGLTSVLGRPSSSKKLSILD
ncbi:geranylgeranyl diphosphate reductase-like [Tripterygium wilfordii]|uniref:geranylgeranyl diphosphate reductase-like n=1 Tax=Tripterygium wilfordii TaxID=458696 RepID=UPI0018F80CAC|nr:geranylgeranyl diphosphate reductase-like [Tripterygium wilfordii]